MEMPWVKDLVGVTAVILFLGGLFGMLVGLWLFATGRPVNEYYFVGVGAGYWFLFSTVAFYIRSKL